MSFNTLFPECHFKEIMNPLIKRKLKLILLFCIFSMPAGILYQRLNNGYIDHNAFIVGLVMGLAFGVLELFILTKFNRRIKVFPIPIIIFTKTIVYTIIIFFTSNLLGLIAGFFEGKTWDIFFKSLYSIKQLYFITYSLLTLPTLDSVNSFE